MPVTRVKSSECPNDSIPSQPAFDDGIGGDVIVIVEIDKRERAGGQKHHEREKCEEQSDEARSRHAFLLSDFAAVASGFPAWPWDKFLHVHRLF